MDFRGQNLFVFLFLLVCVLNLANELATASNTTYFNVPMTQWIQEQLRGDRDVCADILQEKWKNVTKPKLNPCGTLTVWVPKKTGFTQFVDVNKDGKLIGGFSIAIFCLALQELPFKIQTIFVPFINQTYESKGDYDDLVHQIKGQDCQAVAGDVTISEKRTVDADFTIPYMSSQVYMLVPATQEWNQTLVTLLKPFSVCLWFTIIAASIFIGVAIGILEYRVGNPEFEVPFYQKLVMIIWFPISTFFFHEGRIYNRFSKFVLVIWLTMIFIVIQIFTASLSSWLVINQLKPISPQHYHKVGYQTGSFVRDLSIVRKMCPTMSLEPLSSMKAYKEALESGNVHAVFDEIPYIDMFLAKYKHGYLKVGPLAEEPGLGFGFSRGSLIQTNFSRAIVKVTESEDMIDMKRRYLGILTPFQSQPTQPLPQSLNVRSFTLLFILMGIATIVAIICSEISLMRQLPQIFPTNNLPGGQSQTISLDSNQVPGNEH